MGRENAHMQKVSKKMTTVHPAWSSQARPWECVELKDAKGCNKQCSVMGNRRGEFLELHWVLPLDLARHEP
jgi:hypothetical protein